MLENNTIDVITGMAGRNVKVAFDLLPSAISGFVLQEGKKKDIGMKSGHEIHYDWSYSNFGNPEFIINKIKNFSHQEYNNEDYNKIPKYKNIEEYKNQRISSDTTPIDKDDALKKLYQQNEKEEQESVALAFYYAKQLEKSKKKNESFWSGLKQLTNF
jgi:hypothetical protein